MREQLKQQASSVDAMTIGAMKDLIARQDDYIEILIDLLEDWTAVWNESRRIDELALYSATMREI